MGKAEALGLGQGWCLGSDEEEIARGPSLSPKEHGLVPGGEKHMFLIKHVLQMKSSPIKWREDIDVHQHYGRK